MTTAIRATEKLHDVGQSLWLDNITRGLLTSGTLRQYIADFSITGLTSNPTIFEHAFRNGHDYDDAIRSKSMEGRVGETLFFELAMEDLRQAADLFQPTHLLNQLGIAIAHRTYRTYRTLLESSSWQRMLKAGARPQRLLWASTGTKDRAASDLLYIKALALPFTVNTMPEPTLNALADHGDIESTMATDGGDCEEVLSRFAEAGIDIVALAAQLQDEGAKSFVKSWNDLLVCIASKCETVQ